MHNGLLTYLNGTLGLWHLFFQQDQVVTKSSIDRRSRFIIAELNVVNRSDTYAKLPGRLVVYIVTLIYYFKCLTSYSTLLLPNWVGFEEVKV